MTDVNSTPVVKAKKTSKKSADSKKEAKTETKPVKPVKPVKPETKKVPKAVEESVGAGFNISPAKVKNVISKYVLNKDISAAIDEIKSAQPSKTKKTVDGVEVIEESAGKPVSQLSAETLASLKQATDDYESGFTASYVKTKVSALSEASRLKYNSAKKEAQVAHELKNSESLTPEPFDLRAFNVAFDKDFYKTLAIPVSADTEWKSAIDKLAKLKNRFSVNSRILISAFTDEIVKQAMAESISTCLAENKKIIQLSHISKWATSSNFKLFPLIAQLSTYKKAVADESKKGDDVFTLPGVPSDVHYQFRHYVSELCKDKHSEMIKADGVETNISISKAFKNFCSTLVCEFLMLVGKMLLIEIKSRDIKTVNDYIIKTVIQHYHAVCCVDEADTMTAIRESINKHYEFVKLRQEKKNTAA